MEGENSAPFFIVGSGRSGSTLLRLMLCAHSKVAVPPETYFISPLIEQLPITQRLDEKQVSLAIDIITNHYRWPDMGMTIDYLVATAANLRAPFLRDILNIIYDYHLELERKSIWGDKTPAYIAIVPRLLELYPGAKIIHLIRDGRDVARSFQATGWYGPWLHKNTREWQAAIQHGRQYKDTCPDVEIHEVKYEDLVLHTETTMRNVCNHVGLEYEPGMQDWGNAAKGRIPAREAYIHKKIARQPEENDICRWESEMTNREILVVESYIYNELKLAGYGLYYSAPPWVVVFYFCRAYCTVILPVYDLAIRLLRYIHRRLSVLH